MNGAIGAESCALDVKVTCDVSLDNDLFRPANVDMAMLLTVAINDAGLLTLWDLNGFSNDAAEVAFRFGQWLRMLDDELASPCVEAMFEGESCIELLIAGVDGFWEANSEQNAEQVVRAFAVALAAGDLGTAKSLVDFYFRADGSILGVEVPDSSDGSLRRIADELDGLGAVVCPTSVMDGGQRLLTCRVDVVTAEEIYSAEPAIRLIEGRILAWVE